MQRVNCFTAGCSTCCSGIKVSDSKYTCKYNPTHHKEIDGRDCGEFRCNKSGSKFMLCRKCRKGKPE